MRLTEWCLFPFCAEPLPAGMLDQFEDGEVEVKPVALTGASVNSDTVCLKLEEPVLQPVQNSFSEIPRPLNLPGDNSSEEKPKKPPKQKQIKCTNLEKGSRNPQTSSCRTERRNQVKTVSRMEGQENTQAPDEEALRKNLPRIPCLSSFKKQPKTPWSFSEFVEDYEYFIKEGLEREVEILRSYSGPGEEHHELPRNGGVEWEEVEHCTETVANGVVSGDSDGSYSSRASSSSREGNSHLEAFSEAQERNAAPAVRQGHTRFCPTPEKPQEPPPAPKQNQVKKKDGEKKAKQKNRCHQSPSPSARGTEDDCSCSSEDDGVPYEAWSYKNYWKSYYQAWQNYYAAVSHYRSSYRLFSWLNAYQVNSVYLQELLKSGD